MSDKPMNVYQCIAAVSAEIAKTGISKSRSNNQEGYKFRGIDEVYNAISPIISKHGLVVLPRMLSRTIVERVSKKGNPLFNVVVEAEFDFVSAHDASKHTVRTFGEAMDSGDKATNKAMSAAYKYAAFQTFCIPTEGDNDADSTTHEVAATVPDGYVEWLADLEACADTGTEPLKAMWLQSKPDYRVHLTKTANDQWEALKKKASSVKPVEELAHA